MITEGSVEMLNAMMGKLLIGATVVVSMGGAAGAEAATPNVVTVIKQQDALVRKMPGFKIYQEGLNEPLRVL